MRKVINSTKVVFVVCLIAFVLQAASAMVNLASYGTPLPPDGSVVPIIFGLGSGVFACIFGVQLRKESQAKKDDSKSSGG